MDPSSVAEALVMRRAADEFMRRGVRSDNSRCSSRVRANIAVLWCGTERPYDEVAQELHKSGAADEFLRTRFSAFDRRWRVAVRLRCYVLKLYTTGREYDARR
jgi:hypothetical protein